MTILRARRYDPLDTVRESVRELAERVTTLEQRRRQQPVERQRYRKLRQFRARAIQRLAAAGSLTYHEIGEAFDLSAQRIEQIVNNWPGGRREKGERSVVDRQPKRAAITGDSRGIR